MTQDQGRLLGNRYRLVAAVGRGGMGTVWRAYDEVLHREVAIKEVLLPPGLSTAERDVLYQRTFREARASARLNHPSVVTVHDVLSEHDRPWIVMELVRARSLQDVIDEDGTVTPGVAADIGRQVLGALSHAHRAGILHRDVKPSNVLITADGRAVLTDFGIAQVEGDVGLTQTGLVMGSPAYIPPERVQGERAVPASDLWALGATLYAAVEGKAPYERSDAMAVLAAALTEEVPAPRHAGSLARVLYGLLAREPAQRMTAEAAMPLLIDVANERAAPPVADATMLDQPVTPRPGALETVLDSSAIEGALRDHPATMQGFEQPAAFRQEHPRTEIARDPAPQEHPRTQVSPEQAAREQIPWAEAQRGQHEERTEIQPSWQPPAPDPWQRPPGTAHQTPYGAPQPYEPRQPVYETPQSAYESYQQSQQSQQPQYAQQQHAQPEYTQAQYQQPHPARRTRLVVLVLVAALVVAASLILGAIILRNMSSASGPPAPSGSASAAAAAASPAGYEKKQESGFSVAVPAGWSRDESAQGVFFRAPDGTTALQIGQTPWTVTTAGEQAASCDVSFAGRTKVFPGYSRKSINDAIPYQGTQASDLEFTYTDTQGRTVHAVDRFVRINGRPYAIYFRCLDGNWTAYQRTLAAIDNSFRAG